MAYTSLRDEMRRQGLSIRQLAIKSNITSQDLTQALNGKKPFYPGWRKRVSESLNKAEKDLFPEEDANEESQND